jgi:hypothetical protein
MVSEGAKVHHAHFVVHEANTLLLIMCASSVNHEIYQTALSDFASRTWSLR